MSSRLRSITPLIPTGGSLEAALAFYTEHMRFSVTWFGSSMAGIERDDIALNLANVGPLEMKSWGRREFHMIVPSGVCLQFYQHG